MITVLIYKYLLRHFSRKIPCLLNLIYLTDSIKLESSNIVNSFILQLICVNKNLIQNKMFCPVSCV